MLYNISFLTGVFVKSVKSYFVLKISLFLWQISERSEIVKIWGSIKQIKG